MFRSFTTAAVLGSALLLAPTAAFAGRFETRDRGERYERHDDRRDDHRDHNDHRSGNLGIHIGGGHVQAPPPPVYHEHVAERVWVPPVTQCVTEQVWVPATYTTVYERVWDPTCGRLVDRPRQVLSCAGHYDTVTREVVVVPGHWELRPTRVVVAPPPRDQFHLDLRIPLGR